MSFFLTRHTAQENKCILVFFSGQDINLVSLYVVHFYTTASKSTAVKVRGVGLAKYNSRPSFRKIYIFKGNGCALAKNLNIYDQQKKNLHNQTDASFESLS